MLAFDCLIMMSLPLDVTQREHVVEQLCDGTRKSLDTSKLQAQHENREPHACAETVHLLEREHSDKRNATYCAEKALLAYHLDCENRVAEKLHGYVHHSVSYI